MEKVQSNDNIIFAEIILGDSRVLYLSENGIKKIRTLSLFSGAGGLDNGFNDVEFDIVESVEIEEKFCQTLDLMPKVR